jgi:ketosteroid isomerase-like protein
MASAEENAALIRRGYEYFNTGNLEALAGIFADEAVWHAAGRGPFAGDKRGRDAAFAYFGQIAEATGGTFRTEPHDIVASGEHVVGLHTATGQRQGRTLSLHEVLVFHLRDGTITEVWEHFADSQTWDEFFR